MAYRTVARDPRYSVDENGNVIGPRGRILKWIRAGKYPAVHLGMGNNTYVHHIVADAFLGPRPDGMWVLHRDDNTENPHKDNLYYGTRERNTADAITNGRTQKGERHWNYKHGGYVGL